jgi:hypothetical protein
LVLKKKRLADYRYIVTSPNIGGYESSKRVDSVDHSIYGNVRNNVSHQQACPVMVIGTCHGHGHRRQFGKPPVTI